MTHPARPSPSPSPSPSAAPSRLAVRGLGFWSPAWPDWPSAAAALRGQPGAAASPGARPAPTLLATHERRRAPESVLMALQVAQEACSACGADAARMPSVFTSAHGDLAIVDALCRTLAHDPMLLSPLRFHHSVHNAASGYWAIACGSRAASTALAAGACSFANGWLEAALQVRSDGDPGCEVLLVGFDTEAVGALRSVNHSRGLLAVALVLGPAGERAGRGLGWRLQPGPAAAAPLRSDAARSLQANAMADALPLFEALARADGCCLSLPLSARLSLQLTIDAV